MEVQKKKGPKGKGKNPTIHHAVGEKSGGGETTKDLVPLYQHQNSGEGLQGRGVRRLGGPKLPTWNYRKNTRKGVPRTPTK